MIDEAKELYKTDKSYSVMVPGKEFIHSIKWKDVNMDDDQFLLQMFPISSLPSEPAGRISTISEMMQGGLISPQTGRRLLDFSDRRRWRIHSSRAYR